MFAMLFGFVIFMLARVFVSLVIRVFIMITVLFAAIMSYDGQDIIFFRFFCWIDTCIIVRMFVCHVRVWVFLNRMATSSVLNSFIIFSFSAVYKLVDFMWIAR
uniref:Uncharacterized protein n=1 Tax=Cacopsylla melanoneura TaxID=428564 RepID=A0A8D8X1R0_9HEMI